MACRKQDEECGTRLGDHAGSPMRVEDTGQSGDRGTLTRDPAGPRRP